MTEPKSFIVLQRVKSFTWLVVEETTNAPLRSVEEGRCHGVIFPICTEQLGRAEKGERTRQRHVSPSDLTGFGPIVLTKPRKIRFFSSDC